MFGKLVTFVPRVNEARVSGVEAKLESISRAQLSYDKCRILHGTIISYPKVGNKTALVIFVFCGCSP